MLTSNNQIPVEIVSYQQLQGETSEALIIIKDLDLLAVTKVETVDE